jgi:5S rRNA maturation endonuclease (ribonuclease M5)
MEQTINSYIEKFILKSGEELEINPPITNSLFSEVKIIKRTNRTYRMTGILTIASTINLEPEQIDEELRKIGFTPKKKVPLDDHDRKILQWLEEGWIIKEVRFEKDGKTIQSADFRMGFRLYLYEQKLLEDKENETRDQFLELKKKAVSTLSEMDKPNSNFEQRVKGIQSIIAVIQQLEEMELNHQSHFPRTWPMTKRLKFLHFIIAFIQISTEKSDFDWKEIGARYYQKIGGSKAFDTNKQEFIDLLEEWANTPAVQLGLTSLGQITSLYFSGNLTGNYSSYHWGPVHALTDLSISQEHYRTQAEVLWLVENRAILTRMAAQNPFLQKTNSLILCIDGHLRTSHKNCIRQILDNSHVKQVIIWSDYDQAGSHIANGLYTFISSYEKLRLKWITPEQEVITDKIEYENYLADYLKTKAMEQEQILGGVEDWTKWVQH